MGLITITVLFVMVVYSLPGIVLSHILWKNAAGRTEKLVFGSVIGLAASCYMSVIVGYFAGWKPWAIVGVLLLVTFIGFAIKKRYADREGYFSGSDPWSRGEYIACVITACFVGIFLFVCFSSRLH